MSGDPGGESTIVYSLPNLSAGATLYSSRQLIPPVPPTSPVISLWTTATLAISVMSQRSILALLVALVPATYAFGGDAPSGEAIYARSASLVPRREAARARRSIRKSLAGERIGTQLAKLIAKTMPEDDPGACVGEDAAKVAAYIHEAFYSPAAQATGNARPDRTLAADRPPVSQRRRRPDRQLSRARTGLGRQPRPAGRVFQVAAVPRRRHASSTAIDPNVAFDFGDSSPAIEGKFEPTSSRSAGKARSSPPRRASTSSSSAPSTPTRLWVNDHERAADRRLGEVGQRHRVPRRRSTCSAGGPIRCGWSSPRPSKGSTTRRRTRQPPAGEGVDRAASGSRPAESRE